MRLALAHGFEAVRQRKHIVLKRGLQTLILSCSPRCPFASRTALGDLTRMLKENP